MRLFNERAITVDSVYMLQSLRALKKPSKISNVQQTGGRLSRAAYIEQQQERRFRKGDRLALARAEQRLFEVAGSGNAVVTHRATGRKYSLPLADTFPFLPPSFRKSNQYRVAHRRRACLPASRPPVQKHLAPGLRPPRPGPSHKQQCICSSTTETTAQTNVPTGVLPERASLQAF